MTNDHDGDHIQLSIGEFETLIVKALRGAGYPWGLAADGGVAARRVAIAGRPAAAIVLALLRRVDGTRIEDLIPSPHDGWQSASGTICPVCAGATLTDFAANDATIDGVLADPNLVEPMLTMALTRSPRPSHGEPVSRVPVVRATFKALMGFAHRTLAPATEASRDSGAGAGPADQD